MLAVHVLPRIGHSLYHSSCACKPVSVFVRSCTCAALGRGSSADGGSLPPLASLRLEPQRPNGLAGSAGGFASLSGGGFGAAAPSVAESAAHTQASLAARLLSHLPGLGLPGRAGMVSEAGPVGFDLQAATLAVAARLQRGNLQVSDASLGTSALPAPVPDSKSVLTDQVLQLGVQLFLGREYAALANLVRLAGLCSSGGCGSDGVDGGSSSSASESLVLGLSLACGVRDAPAQSRADMVARATAALFRTAAGLAQPTGAVWRLSIEFIVRARSCCKHKQPERAY